MKERPRGIDLANAAVQLLHPEGAPVEQEHGWTLAQAEDKVSHLTGSKPELLQAIAYLACQVHAYRKISNEDAALALTKIEIAIKAYKENRRP